VHRLPHGRPSPDLEPAREGELLTCDSCSRLLYWDPSMAPVADPEKQQTAKPKRKASKPAPEEEE